MVRKWYAEQRVYRMGKALHTAEKTVIWLSFFILFCHIY